MKKEHNEIMIQQDCVSQWLYSSQLILTVTNFRSFYRVGLVILKKKIISHDNFQTEFSHLSMLDIWKSPVKD